MPPPPRYGLAAARVPPWFARPMVWFTARQALGGKMIDQLSKSMSPPDAELLRRQDVREGVGRGLAESFRQGNGPATWDGVAVARGEAFRLEEIETEVLICHGKHDRNDPVAMRKPRSDGCHMRAPSTTPTMGT